MLEYGFIFLACSYAYLSGHVLYLTEPHVTLQTHDDRWVDWGHQRHLDERKDERDGGKEDDLRTENVDTGSRSIWQRMKGRTWALIVEWAFRLCSLSSIAYRGESRDQLGQRVHPQAAEDDEKIEDCQDLHEFMENWPFQSRKKEWVRNFLCEIASS